MAGSLRAWAAADAIPIAFRVAAGSPVAFKRVGEDNTNELIQVTGSDGEDGFVIKKAGAREYRTGKDGGGWCSPPRMYGAEINRHW